MYQLLRLYVRYVFGMVMKLNLNKMDTALTREETLKINQSVTAEEIAFAGLKELNVAEVSAKIYEKGDKVYFFDEIDSEHYRLYSVIHKRSFFL